MTSPTQEKIAVYIDGSNFYKYLKDKQINLSRGVKFDYKKFVDFLVNDRQLVYKGYYTGIARNVDKTKKSEVIVRGQQKFLAMIVNDGFTVRRSRIMYDSGKIREKGTDVNIAVDLVVDAIENTYDTAILVSSDTDLLPAIEYIKRKGKKLEYVGFSHAPSFGMQKFANFSILLLPKDVEKFKESRSRRNKKA